MTRLYALVIAIAVLGTAIVSCGIPLDDSPAELGQVPDALAIGQLPTPTPVPEDPSQRVFMVGPDNRLFPVFRDASASPSAVIESLFNGTEPEETAQRINTAITRTSGVAEVDYNPLFQLAIVTLEAGSLDSDPEEQLLAFGQIVFTLTELPDLESVGFEIEVPGGEAEPLAVQTDIGITTPGEQVRRSNFASIDPGGNLIAFPDDDAIAPTPEVQRQVFEVAIWVINDRNELVPITREVEEVNRAQALLQSLFDGGLPTTAVAEGLRTAIPLDATTRVFNIREVERLDGTTFNLALVDLAGERTLPPLELGDERLLAVAQIVFTLTGLTEIDQVLITIDGQYVSMPTQFGQTEPANTERPVGLQRSDFSDFAPGVQIVDRLTPTPGPTSTVDPAAPLPPADDPATSGEPRPTPTATPEP